MDHLNARFNTRRQRMAAWIGIALTAIGAVAAGFQFGPEGFLFIAASIVVALAFLLTRRTPALFSLLFVVAVMMNAVGTVWWLFRKTWWFDDVMHLYGCFSITLLFGSFAWGRISPRFTGRTSRFLIIMGLGMLIGVAWEVAEWVASAALPITIMRGGVDTAGDLIMDAVGAAVGALFVIRACRDCSERSRCEGSGGKDFCCLP